jgi:uncharacterized protein
MGHFFFGLYKFFSGRRILLWSLLALVMAISGLLASRIRMHEEVSKTMARGSGPGRFQEVISRTNLADKLIIRIFPRDSSCSAGPSELITYASIFIDTLKHQFDTNYLKAITPDPSDTVMQEFMSLIEDNVPVYLDEADYVKIDSLIRPDAVRDQMARNFRLLSTPAGMVARERILRDPLGFSFLALRKLRSLSAGDQFEIIDGFVFTRDHKNILLFITPANPAGETARNSELIAGIKGTISALDSRIPGIHAEYWGGVAIAAGNASQLKKDIALTLAIAVILIFLLLAWYFRSLLVPLSGFLPALFGGLFALALMYLIKGTISAIALGIGAVLLGLIVDYALYIINRYRKIRSMELVIREMSQTIIVCSLTSIGAFLCLLFLDSAVLFDLGLFAAFSLGGAALFALVFLPHMPVERMLSSRSGELTTFVDRIGRISYEKKTWLIISLVATGMISLFFAGRVRFEEDMNKLNFVDHDLLQAGQALDRINEVSLKNVFVVATGKTLDAALSDARVVLPVLDSLQKAGTIRKVSGVQQLLLPGPVQQERLRRWKIFWSGDRILRVESSVRESARQLGMKPSAFEPFLATLRTPGEGLSPARGVWLARTFFRDWITFTPGMVMVSTNVKVSQENRNVVYQSFAKEDGVTVFDRQLLTQRFVESVREDFGRLVKLTMIFVTLLLILSFGRIELGLITAMPMFFSWLLTLGFMGITGIRFNIFNIIISSFIFGLGVDYSILMMRGLIHRYKYGEDETGNYRVSVFLSASTTLFGVGALFFAKHPALHSISVVSVVGITAVVLIAWTIEPLIVRWLLIGRLEKRSFPVTARVIFHSLIVAWIPITTIAIILVVYASLIAPILPLKKKKKQQLFHWLFSRLSRLYIASNFPGYHQVENAPGEDFGKPAIIISNHQSLIETPALLRMHPNILILTTEWIYHNAVFGPVARASGFIPIAGGMEHALDLMKQRSEEGYSILIFPEGSRSRDGSIRRFHRGAFFTAEKLNLDLVPILVFGSGDYLKKGAFWGQPNRLFMKIMRRIAPDDVRFGTTYQERARNIRKFYSDEYAAYKALHGNPSYYRYSVVQNYVYKGPVLEWYVRTKLRLENNFQDYHENLPSEGEILDLGCGYGYLSLMMAFTSDGRRITGVDHDPEKIAVASHCYGKPDRVEFICGDVTTFDFSSKDGIVLGDLLHYLQTEQQRALLERCLLNLNPGGVILIREGLHEEGSRHGRTRLTEFFSTHIGFNKVAGGSKTLHFPAKSLIVELAAQYGMKAEVIASKKRTSNQLIRIRRGNA